MVIIIFPASYAFFIISFCKTHGLFSNIIHIRQKKQKGKKLEKWEQDFYNENKSLIDFKQKDQRSDEEKEKLRDYFGYKKK